MTTTATLLLLVAVSAAEDAPKKPSATTDIRSVDADFAYQGEYVASVRTGRRSWYSWGLQVVARGQGRFDAYVLNGGLPGAGWDGSSRRKLNGHRQGEVALLTDADGRLEITPSGATLFDQAGQVTHVFAKVARQSPNLGTPPPANAVVLFDGTDTGELKDLKITPDGLMQIGSMTKRAVQDFRLHIEFRTPYMPDAQGQGRGNSGVYIQQRYEVQILDSFGLDGAFNECGSLYRQQTPDVNMCLPPLTWQSYDIYFTAAKFDDQGKKIASARITVIHNGVPVHSDREIKDKTGAGQKEGPDARPILFQNHGDPVHFRNVWLVETAPGEPCADHCGGPIRRLLQRLCHCRR